MQSSESACYDDFVKRSLCEIREGLALDNSDEKSKKGRVKKELDRIAQNSDFSAAQKVVQSRFVIGGDDASYLSSGLAMLWSTVGAQNSTEADKSCDELPLAPASLYAPDAVLGIRRGFIAAMKRRNDDMRRDAPSQIPLLMKSLLPLLPFIYTLNSEKKQEMDNLLRGGTPRTHKDREALFEFLLTMQSATKKVDYDETTHLSLASMILEQCTRKHADALALFKTNLVDVADKDLTTCITAIIDATDTMLVSMNGFANDKADAVYKQLEALSAAFDDIKAKLQGPPSDGGNAGDELVEMASAVIQSWHEVTNGKAFDDLQNAMQASDDHSTGMKDTLVVLKKKLEDVLSSSREQLKHNIGLGGYVPIFMHSGMTYNGTHASKWVDTAVLRGLVGQRAPTEQPGDEKNHPNDALLPYHLPKIDSVREHLIPVQTMIQSTPDPTEEEVDKAMAAFAWSSSALGGEGAKRQRLSQSATHLHSPSISSEALALFRDNFAIIGETPAEALPEERCGVELPHEVRWMPQGRRGITMARVAVLEHAIARCTQLARKKSLHATVANALLHAATTLKIHQLEPLYELQEASAFDDDPHPLGTGAMRLVTRPCAVVRGTLSFPVDLGVAALSKDQMMHESNASLTQTTSLLQAMGKTEMATATLRNGLRRRGMSSNVYVAPQASELHFHSAPTGTPAEKSDPEVEESLRCETYRREKFALIVNRLIVLAASLSSNDENDGFNSSAKDKVDVVGAFLDANKPKGVRNGGVDARERRQGLWIEMQRHLAISQDRLWIFLRLMSGKIGGNVTEVITLADEATLKAAKAIQEQRLEISKRVSDMQSKIVETVVTSMLKNSNMTMDYKGSELAVVDSEARKDLHELSSGLTGRPFFEANVALKNLTTAKAEAPPLKDVLSGLANIGVEMQETLEKTLAEPSAASASLAELSHPSNCYFVSMRADAVAAVRGAHEKLNCELGVLGGCRRLTLWELVEGGCTVLVERFAELCGFMLVQSRTSTGVSSMYVSHQSMYTNTSQARVALARLVSAARAYAARVEVPQFHSDNSEEARCKVMVAGENVSDMDVSKRSAGAYQAQPRVDFRYEGHYSGWSNVGFRRS
jgi:hypothetical protein